TSAAAALMHSVEAYIPYILWLYALGLVLMLARFAVNLRHLHTLKTRGISAPGEKWASLVTYWRKYLGIARPVRLFISERVNVPVMLGALKPVILLPLATVNHLSTEQVEAILLHELAHIKRHDYLLNMLQVALETILFFNPFVWLISRTIRR